MMFEEICSRFVHTLDTLGCDVLYREDYYLDDIIESDVPDVLNPINNKDCLSIYISPVIKSKDINFIIGIQLTFRNYKYNLKVENVVATDIVLALISVGMYKTAIRFIFNNSSSTCNLLDVYSVPDTIFYLEDMNVPVGMLEMYLNYCQNFANKYIREYNTTNERLKNIILKTFIIEYNVIGNLLEDLDSIEYRIVLMKFVNSNMIDDKEEDTIL